MLIELQFLQAVTVIFLFHPESKPKEIKIHKLENVKQQINGSVLEMSKKFQVTAKQVN